MSDSFEYRPLGRLTLTPARIDANGVPSFRHRLRGDDVFGRFQASTRRAVVILTLPSWEGVDHEWGTAIRRCGTTRWRVIGGMHVQGRRVCSAGKSLGENAASLRRSRALETGARRSSDGLSLLHLGPTPPAPPDRGAAASRIHARSDPTAADGRPAGGADPRDAHAAAGGDRAAPARRAETAGGRRGASPADRAGGSA